jgi:hypothetical protein
MPLPEVRRPNTCKRNLGNIFEKCFVEKNTSLLVLDTKSDILPLCYCAPQRINVMESLKSHHGISASCQIIKL